MFSVNCTFIFLNSFAVMDRNLSISRNSRLAAERQAVKKPRFFFNSTKFSTTRSSIKPFNEGYFFRQQMELVYKHSLISAVNKSFLVKTSLFSCKDCSICGVWQSSRERLVY